MLVLVNGPRTTAFKLLLRAVIHWLSEFPQSPLGSECTLNELVTIECIYRLFLMLLNHNDFEAVSQTESINIAELFLHPCVLRKQANDELVLPMNFLRQIECIDQLVKHHLEAALLRRSSSLEHFGFIDWHRVFLVTREEELYSVLRLLLTIGMQTSKLSTFGLTAINFLDDVDQDCLSAFLGRSYSDPETGGTLDPSIIAGLQSEAATKNKLPGPRHQKH